MKIVEFLNEKAVSANLKATTKEATIRELVDILAKAEGIKNREELVKVLLNREVLGSTGIGQGVGIPHGKTDTVKKLVAAFGICHHGVDFDALDGEPVYIFFLLVAPKETAGPHLKALAQISRLLRDSYFCELIKRCQSPDELYELIKHEEEKKH